MSLILTLTDPDGYNGFPGTVHAQVRFTLSRDHALRIDYQATTDKSTVINVTNHSYFNLAGEGSGDIYGQLLRINANRYTPVDANLIPTGALPPVAGTPFDFRASKPIGRDIRQGNQQLVIAHGYDHNWVLNGTGLRLAAVAEDPSSGRVLKTYTTEPGVQFYTGNFLQGDLVGHERSYLPPERRVHAGDPALPGLAQPSELPDHSTGPRTDVHLDHDLQVLDRRPRRASPPVTAIA